MESNNCFFSVVIPVFNKERFIGNTIESVLKQTYRNFELLLVIDPCTDNTVEIINSFRDDRIRIFKRNESGAGGYAARNLGILNAKSEWIAFLDADDTWHLEYLERIHDAIQNNPDKQVFCTGYEIETCERKYEHSFYKKHKWKEEFLIDFKSYLSEKPICAINVVAAKGLMLKIRGFPEKKYKRGADNETWLRMMNEARSAVWVNYVGATYNKTDDISVTKANVHYVSDHPVRQTALKLIQQKKNLTVVVALKQFSNSFVFPGLKAKTRRGELRIVDLKALFWNRSLLKKEYFFLIVLAFVPSFIQKKVSSR